MAFVSIKSVSSGQYLDGRNSGMSDPLLSSSSRNPATDEYLQWVIGNIGGGDSDRYFIKSVSSGQYLDGRNSGMSDPLLSSSSRNPATDAYLQWRIRDIGHGWYCIQSVSSGQYLDGRNPGMSQLLLSSSSRDPGTDVYLQWRIETTRERKPEILGPEYLPTCGATVVDALEFFAYEGVQFQSRSDQRGSRWVPGEGFLPDRRTCDSSTTWSDPRLLALRLHSNSLRRHHLIDRDDERANVWLGSYNDESVVVKQVGGNSCTMANAIAFALQLKVLAPLHHPGLVRIIGAEWRHVLEMQVVTEFIPGDGDLLSCLVKNPEWTWHEKVAIAMDVVDALAFLHAQQPKIVLRDLRARHVLVDDHGRAQINTIPSSVTDGETHYRHPHERRSPPYWRAPEISRGLPLTEAADLYSFGVVLMELAEQRPPDDDRDACESMLERASSGSSSPPDYITELACECLDHDPSKRPTAMGVKYKLLNILKNEL